METFAIKNLSFTYPGKQIPALKNLNLQVKQGEFFVLCGKSGCGKSTFLRNLKTALAPHGSKAGEILFCGRPLETVSQREQAEGIGYVLQNPDSQLVTDKVWHELAFGLESLGYDTKTIRLRVAEMASFFGIQRWFMKEVNQLSGGQKQLLNLASVMVMQPDVLILDEPTSQLDPIAAGDFLETVRKINRELGTTVIISEHRLEDVIPMADRVAVMDQGRIIADDVPAGAGAKLAQMGHEMFMAMPAPMQAYAMLYQEGIGRGLECPADIREGRNWLTRLFDGKEPQRASLLAEELPERKGQEPVLRMKDVWFKYNRNDEDVIKDLSMEVYEGELFCLAGGNGTGKTTALTLASGINRPYRGKVQVYGKNIQDIKNRELFNGILGVLPQNPQSIFVEKTVRLDLLEILEGRQISAAEKEQRVLDIAKQADLEHLLEMHPYDLSGGEQQRAALAKILLLNPKILLLDEPTKGLDRSFKKTLAEILKRLQMQGTAIIMVSHDIEFCARCADRCAMFFDGKIVTENTPRNFFAGNSFYTTAANRMSRHLFSNAVITEDIVQLCRENLTAEPFSGREPEDPPASECEFEDVQPPQAEPVKSVHSEKSARGKNVLYGAVMLILAPLTLLAGCFLLDDRKYYFVSLMLIFYTMIPFFAGFERKKFQAKELVIIAVLIAFGVIGRAAFFMLPQFKPVLAMVIIAGIALGRESGFLAGAMTAFVSNFIFGQGPWTPWQMFAMGLIGFLAGLLAQRGILSKNRKIPILIFGGISALLYGLIVDIWSIFSMTSEPSWAVAAAVYGSSLPFNLILGAATICFLCFLAKPMLEKLERMKAKYGLDLFV